MKKILLPLSPAAAPGLLLLCLLLLGTVSARAQSWSRAETVPAPVVNDNGYARSTAVATDAQGNVYVAGNFYGRVSFGATLLVAAGPDRNADFFVAKVSPAGQWLWAIRAGGAADDYANDLVLDAQGSVYLAGRLGPDATLGSFTPNTTSGYANAFVAKLSAAGQFLWVTVNGAETASSLALDAGGNLLVTGTYYNTAVTIGAFTLPTYGYTDVWAAKLDPTGTQWLWAVRAGSNGNDYSNQIGTDAAGNAYLAGEYGGTAAFGPYSLATGNSNAYVAKLTPAGQFAYATRLTSTNNLYARSLAVSAAGDVFVAGSFQGASLTLGSIRLNNNNSTGSYTDGYVARLTPTGAFQWGVALGGSSDETANGLALDAAGALYVTGTFESTSAVLGGITITNVTSYTGNAFVGRMNPATGAWAWATAVGSYDEEAGVRISVGPAGTVAATGTYSSLVNTFGSTTLSGTTLGIYPSVYVGQLSATAGTWNWARGTGGGGERRISGTCADAQGNVYATGTFIGAVSFGSTTLTSTTRGNDIFVAKRSPAGQWLWAAQAGGNAADRGQAVAVDAQGNAYVSGYFAQGAFPTTAPSFSATFGATTLTSTGSADLFVAKLDPGGQWLWATRAGSTGDDNAPALAVDAGGAAYVTGSYYSPSSLQFGSLTLAGASSQGGAYAAQLSPAGQWVWAVPVGTGPGTGSVGRTLALDGGGALYCAGSFSATKAFGSTSLTSAGGTDGYLARLDGATGAIAWATRLGGIYSDDVQAVALDDQGTPHLAATLTSRSVTIGTTALNNASPGLLVARLTPTGQLTWSALAGATTVGEAGALAVAPGGTVYVAGQFQGTLTLGSLMLTSTSTASGQDNRDLVVARLNSTGAWEQAVQSTGGTSGEYATGLVRGAGGQLLVAGYTYSPTLSFDNTTLLGYSAYATGFLVQTSGLVTGTRETGSTPARASYLSPNPVGSEAPALHLPAAPGAEPVVLSVTDALGRVWLRRTLPAAAATVALPELLSCPAGVYLLTLQRGEVRQVLRVVRE